MVPHSLLCSAILRARADSLRSCVAILNDWLSSLIARFWISTEVVYLQRYLVVTWLMPREATAVLVHILCPPYSHAPVYSGTSFEATFWWRMENHIWAQWACSRVENNVINNICSVRVCLAVTCHLHFWQNDRDLLHATVVTQAWNGYAIRVSTESRPWRRKSSHLGLEPMTFRSQVRCSMPLSYPHSPSFKCVNKAVSKYLICLSWLLYDKTFGSGFLNLINLHWNRAPWLITWFG